MPICVDTSLLQTQCFRSHVLLGKRITLQLAHSPTVRTSREKVIPDLIVDALVQDLLFFCDSTRVSYLPFLPHSAASLLPNLRPVPTHQIDLGPHIQHLKLCCTTAAGSPTSSCYPSKLEWSKGDCFFYSLSRLLPRYQYTNSRQDATICRSTAHR